MSAGFCGPLPGVGVQERQGGRYPVWGGKVLEVPGLKLDAYGDVTGFPFYAVFEDGPVALGWIRASHRELDETRSKPWQPVLAHRRELPVIPAEPVPLGIEILPSGTLSRPGGTLRLVIQGRTSTTTPGC